MNKNVENTLLDTQIEFLCELYEKNMISNVMLEQIRSNLYKMININMK